MLLWENCDHFHIEKNSSPRFPSFTHNVLHPLNLLGVPSGPTLECQGLSFTRETKTGHILQTPPRYQRKGGKHFPSWWVHSCYYNPIYNWPSLLQGHISNSSSACPWNSHIFYSENPCTACFLYVMASKICLRWFFSLVGFCQYRFSRFGRNIAVVWQCSQQLHLQVLLQFIE